MFAICDGKPYKQGSFKIGTGGVTKGDLVVWSAGTVVSAAASPTAATVVGIALDTYTAGVLGQIALAGGHDIEADYVGTTKTSLVDTDAGTAFNLKTAQSIDLDSTTAVLVMVGTTYDNTNKKIRGRFTDAILYLS